MTGSRSSGWLLSVPLVCLAFSAPLRAEEPAGKVQEHIYKKGEGYELKMFVHLPPGWKASDRRPAIAFFFGGGWRRPAGTPAPGRMP